MSILNEGRRTLSTLFKSSNDKQVKITNLFSNIYQAEQEINSHNKLISMIEIYLGQHVIPNFKETQMNSYYKICKTIALLEIEDASNIANFWSELIENPNIKTV